MSHTPVNSNGNANANGNGNSNSNSLKPSAIPPSLQPGKNWEDQDKLSDYIPMSADLSRAPTASASVSRAQSKTPSVQADADTDHKMDSDSDDQIDDGGNVPMSSPSKTPRQLEKEREKAERSQARQQEQAKRAAQKQDLATTRNELTKSKLADSIKRFGYLLGQTELFQHFIDIKKDRDPEFAKMLDESQDKLRKKASKRGGDSNRRRKTE